MFINKEKHLVFMIISEREKIEKAKYLIGLSQKVKNNPSPEKKGGFLKLLCPGHTDALPLKVGDIPIGKGDKYASFAIEKAHRLYSHWLRESVINPDKSIVSSYQTRNPKENMWGGAVLFDDENCTPEIVSFSGLSEVSDEALSLILVYSFGLAKDKTLFEKVKKISANPVVDEMFERFKEKYPLAI